MDLLVLFLYDGQQLGLLVKQAFLCLLLLLDDLQQHSMVVLALCMGDAVRESDAYIKSAQKGPDLLETLHRRDERAGGTPESHFDPI
jgi:hypothetical protein